MEWSLQVKTVGQYECRTVVRVNARTRVPSETSRGMLNGHFDGRHRMVGSRIHSYGTTIDTATKLTAFVNCTSQWDVSPTCPRLQLWSLHGCHPRSVWPAVVYALGCGHWSRDNASFGDKAHRWECEPSSWPMSLSIASQLRQLISLKQDILRAGVQQKKWRTSIGGFQLPVARHNVASFMSIHSKWVISFRRIHYNGH